MAQVLDSPPSPPPKREYVKSQRYDKSDVKPTWVLCQCGNNMLPVCADTTIKQKRLHFKVPIRFCPKCRIVKLLEPMEIMK